MRIQINVIVKRLVARVERSVWIQLKRGWVEDVLEIVDKEEREYTKMRKDLECEGRRKEIASRYWESL